jgi:DNA-binding phage protein
MAKIATLKKQKKSKALSLKVHVPFKSDILKNIKVVTDTLFDCIKTGDIETFREVLAAHLMTVNKTEFAKKAGLGRRTIYDLLDPKKEFNPELSTVSALIQAIAA